VAIEQYQAVVGVVEPFGEGDDGGLTRSGHADQRRDGSSRDGERYAVQHWPVFVAEPDLAEFESGHLLAIWYRTGVQHLGLAVRRASAVVFKGKSEGFADALQCAHALGEGADCSEDTSEGDDQVGRVQQEGDQLTQRRGIASYPHASDKQDQ